MSKHLMVYKDHTVETHHHRRTIELAEPHSAKYKGKKFKAKFIGYGWREGEAPTGVTLYGKGKAYGMKIEFRRTYAWDDMPKWVREIIEHA